MKQRQNKPNYKKGQNNKKGKYELKDEPKKTELPELGHNDAEWYFINEQMAKDTASIPFGYSLGSRLNFGPYGGKYNNYAFPGVMEITYTPTYGWNDNNTTPLNVSTRNTYTFLKSENSRAKTYDSPDVGIYTITMDNAVSYYSFMKRLYGVLMTINTMNRYTPNAIVQACGGDFEDLSQHVTQLRDYINVYATKISALPLPGVFSIYKRHIWMCGSLWLDSDSTDKSQVYAFTPNGFYKYKLDDDGAGMCEFDRLPSAHMTFAQIVEYGNDLLERILYGAGEEDFNLIGGDILYSYGRENVILATTINESYSVLPQFNASVLDQIHNARAFYVPDWDAFSSTCDIVQSADKNYIETTPQITYPAVSSDVSYPVNDMAMDQIVDLATMDTDPKNVLVATRLLNIPIIVESGDSRVAQFQSLGTEIVNAFHIYDFGTSTGDASDWTLYQHPALYSYARASVNFDVGAESGEEIADKITASILGVIDTAGIISPFNRHPLIFYWYKSGMESEGAVLGNSYDYAHRPIGAIDNYSFISEEELRNINRNVLMAMFGLDRYGTQKK